MKTIFIVDDNDTNLMTVKMALGDDYRTFAIPSAERMFKLLQKITPDLILLDILMPEMDGFTAMGLLSHNKSYCDIPVIFLTASEDSATKEKGYAMGAKDFISKPFQVSLLLDRIEKVLKGNDI